VVAHVDEINDFVAGVLRLLKPTGIAVFEFAYAVDMIENCRSTRFTMNISSTIHCMG